MGFFSGLFGGGRTKVTQTAQQKTTVNTQVDVTNDIEIRTEEIARVLAEFGAKTTDLTQGIKSLIEKISQQNAIELITQLNLMDLLRRRSKQIGIVSGAIGILWFLNRKKKK